MGDPCLVNLAKATNDELDDIKFALEETKATLEEQNTLKMRLEEANQEIHKLKNSTDEGMIIEEIRKQLKDAKVRYFLFRVASQMFLIVKFFSGHI